MSEHPLTPEEQSLLREAFAQAELKVTEQKMARAWKRVFESLDLFPPRLLPPCASLDTLKEKLKMKAGPAYEPQQVTVDQYDYELLVEGSSAQMPLYSLTVTIADRFESEPYGMGLYIHQFYVLCRFSKP